MKVCGLKGLVCKKQRQQKQVRSQSQFLFLFLRLLLYFLSILHSVLKFTEALQSLNVATFRSGLSRMQPCLKLHLWMASDSFCVEWNQGEGLVKFLFNVWLSEVAEVQQRHCRPRQHIPKLWTKATLTSRANSTFFIPLKMLWSHFPQQEALCTGFSMQHARAHQRTNMVTNPLTHLLWSEY